MNLILWLVILLLLIILLGFFLLGATMLLIAAKKLFQWLLNELSNVIHTFLSGVKVE